MTQPVQEPTEGRQIAALNWRTNQLFRRPAPASGQAGTYRNSVVSYGLKGPDWLTFDEAGGYNHHFSSNFAYDPAVPGGCWFSNETGGTVGDYFIMGAPLGPQGSRWSVDVVYGKGPTGGRLLLEWQTASMDVSGAPELIAKPVVAGTWYIDNNSKTWHIDTYGAITKVAWVTGVVDLYIAGAAGTMLSANGIVPPAGAPITTVFNGAVREMNGGGDGSVMWYMRAKVVTPNSGNTSGDADVRIYAVRFMRLNEGGGEMS